MSIAEIQPGALATYAPPIQPDCFVPEPDECLFEIVNGQRVELPEMGRFSNLLASRLYGLVFQYVDSQGLGFALSEPLFILDTVKDLRRRPDVAFVSHATWPADRPTSGDGDWEVVPDLAVEVISPNDALEQVTAKIGEYFHCGVKQVWLVLPVAALVHIYNSPAQVRILTAEEELTDTVVPGFRLKLSQLFREHDKAS